MGSSLSIPSNSKNDADNRGEITMGSDSFSVQDAELETFEKAVQVLEQVKQVVAGREAPLLMWPIDGLLDVVRACSVCSHPYLKSRLAE